MVNATENAERASLLVWIKEHPSYVLVGGETVRLECDYCGDIVKACADLAFTNLPCMVCGMKPMQIVRHRNAMRTRKRPYTIFVD